MQTIDSMDQVPELHDAIFKTLLFVWKEGTARLEFSADFTSARIQLEARGVSKVAVPRAFPWGPSDSVNTSNLRDGEDGKRLMIEMQSGDLLEIICDELVLLANG